MSVKQWGFDGVVMTDWLSTGKDRADESQAIKAGVDIIMPGGNSTIKALLLGNKKGDLPLPVLKTACGRVLKLILS